MPVVLRHPAVALLTSITLSFSKHDHAPFFLSSGLGLLGRAFSKNCDENLCALYREYQGCFDIEPMMGFVLVMLFVPLGTLTFGALIVEVSQKVSDFFFPLFS